MYFYVISSLDRLVGEDGLLRLPKYIFEEFVEDDERKECIEAVKEAIMSGSRVLIYGPAGCGKTALMAIILKELFDSGYKIGYIVDRETILNMHEEEGVVLFSDDIPRMSENTLRSIVQYNSGMIIATARKEELDLLKRKMGADPLREFFAFELGPMTDVYLREILIRFSLREGIRISNENVIDIVVEKAEGLPVYIWQLVRDLKINRVSVLDEHFASMIPKGMLEYVDDILWRIIGEDPERKEILLTLLIMADMSEYKMHQDLFNAVFAECKREIYGREYTIREILLSDIVDKVCRYLARTYDYSFKLPHDAWRDVLIGKSQGLMSGEISRINSAFPLVERQKILRRAIERAYKEIISHISDLDRKEAFILQVENISPDLLKRFSAKIVPAPEKRLIVPKKPERKPTEIIDKKIREIAIEEPQEKGPFGKTTFVVRKKRKFLGLLIEKFVIYDTSGEYLGTAEVKPGLLTTTVKIIDEDGSELWSIEISGNKANILSIGGKTIGSITKKLFSNIYIFYDENGEEKYIVEKKRERCTIRDIYDAPVASILIGQEKDHLNIIRKISEIEALSIDIIISIIR
ncbi:MAG: ATP-binding protein [Candidatus Njordarchaeota archaeon]